MLEVMQLELTTVEHDELTQCEAVIERDLRTFVNVGNALLTIRDGRLYREDWGTWEEYCQERWGFTRSRAHRLIEAAQATGNLLPMGNIPTSERQARPLTQLSPDDQRIAWERAIETAPDSGITGAHVLRVVDEYRGGATAYNNHAISDTPGYDGDEWYTPQEYVDAVREVMGEIDLDPATCEAAQEQIQAKHCFTKDDNGLDHPWIGRVFLNPPYSMPLVEQFTGKAISEYDAGNAEEAIVLVNNCTDTRWFHKLLDRFPACFTSGRLQFWRPDHGNFSARQGQVFFYLGPHWKGEVFASVFSQFGIVVGKYDDRELGSV